MIQVHEYANLHFDNDKDIHMDFESDKTNGYSHNLKFAYHVAVIIIVCCIYYKKWMRFQRT